MHIFITGVAGFLGSNLNYYLKKNFKVSGNDNLVGGDLEIDKRVNFLKLIVKI